MRYAGGQARRWSRCGPLLAYSELPCLIREGFRFDVQIACGGRGLLHHSCILLGRLVHCADSYADLTNRDRLSLVVACDLSEQPVHFSPPRYIGESPIYFLDHFHGSHDVGLGSC